MTVYGSPDFKAEDLMAYEIGYRSELAPELSLDVAAFYNDYNNLSTVRMGEVGLDSLTAPTQVILPFITANDMHGYTYGAELKVSWQPLSWWRLQVAYSYLKIIMELDDSTGFTSSVTDAEGGSPRHQFSLRSGFDVGRRVTLDLTLRGVDRLESISVGNIPSFVTMDARLAWKPMQNLELAVVGQNLFDDQHQEFIPEELISLPTETERSCYGMVSWNF